MSPQCKRNTRGADRRSCARPWHPGRKFHNMDKADLVSGGSNHLSDSNRSKIHDRLTDTNCMLCHLPDFHQDRPVLTGQFFKMSDGKSSRSGVDQNVCQKSWFGCSISETNIRNMEPVYILLVHFADPRCRFKIFLHPQCFSFSTEKTCWLTKGICIGFHLLRVTDVSCRSKTIVSIYILPQ